MVLTKSLCERCQNLFSTSEGLQALIGPDGYKHHNEADLYRSAQAGCLLCSMISNACKNEGILFRNSDERIMIYDSWGPPERSQKYLDMDKHPLLQQGLPSLIITTDIQGMHLARLATLANFGRSQSSSSCWNQR